MVERKADSKALVRELEGIVGTARLRTEEPLSEHTTFKIGGPAEFFVVPSETEQVVQVVQLCRAEQVPLRVLGMGSNILAPDEGLRGVVLHMGENLSQIRREGDGLVAQAGASNEAVADRALQEGLTGYEFACGIPGSVGGAAIMNAGAYDGCFADVASSVLCLTPEGEQVLIRAEEADWSYRHSMMMDKGYLVLEVTLSLAPGDPATIKAIMDDLTERRQSKQPLEMPSAGSTFKRPEGHFAGKLIQDAGLQGYAIGGAQVSTKHAGFVVNTGSATAEDVLRLIAHIQEKVREDSGVMLEPEVRLWQ